MSGGGRWGKNREGKNAYWGSGGVLVGGKVWERRENKQKRMGAWVKVGKKGVC